MDQKRNAFTLIELLVVIAIIGLLLSILVPSLQLAKERAQFIFCRANLRSYGMVVKQYLGDNDDCYPTNSQTCMFNGSNANNCQWHDPEIAPDTYPQHAGVLWPYMNVMKGHMCPTFERFARTYGDKHPPFQNGNHPTTPPIDPQYAYSFNNFLGSINPRTSRPWGVKKEPEVVNSADTIVWVEETIWLIPETAPYTWAGWVLNDTCFMSRHDDDTTGWGDFIATYHATSLAKKNDGEGNAVFVDGSVRLLDPYEVVNLPGGKQARAGFIHS